MIIKIMSKNSHKGQERLGKNNLIEQTADDLCSVISSKLNCLYNYRSDQTCGKIRT